MATTTPNFGWPVPTSSDLVKNGATAIEGLGDAIDASLLDLKGGTTNQVLAKNSNTDMDFKWVSDATGMTNPMTTTGDTIYSSSGSTPARLGIGSTGQVLTVAAGVPSWATPASGSTFVGCALTRSTAQSIANSAEVIILFDTEDYDTDAFHSTSSNTGRITIPTGKGGKYLVTAQITVNSVGAATQGGIKKNGSDLYYVYTAAVAGTGQPSQPIISFAQQFSLVAGDYIEVFALQTTGAATDVRGNNWNVNQTRFAVQYLGA